MVDIAPNLAVLLTPPEAVSSIDSPKFWKEWQWRGSHIFGDVIAADGGIYGWRDIDLSRPGRHNRQYAIAAIGNGYLLFHHDYDDPPVIVRTTSVASPSAGTVQAVRGGTGGRRRCKESQIAPPAAKGLRGDAKKWPVLTETSSVPIIANSIAIQGGHGIWRIAENVDQVSLIEDLRRCDPRALWRHSLLRAVSSSECDAKAWADEHLHIGAIRKESQNHTDRAIRCIYDMRNIVRYVR